jgi:hypothetical protein
MDLEIKCKIDFPPPPKVIEVPVYEPKMPTPEPSVYTDGALDDTVDLVSSTVESTDTLLDNAKAINKNFRI